MVNNLFHHGVETEEKDLSLAIALAADAKTVLDIGANIGLYAIALAGRNPTATVYAFEAAPTIYERLLRNVERSRLTNIVCVNAAAGRDERPLPIFLPVGGYSTMGTSVLDSVGGKPWWETHRDSLRCDYVSQIRMDAFAASAAPPMPVDFVKLDVERAELFVLEGFGALLSETTSIMCEVLPIEVLGAEQTERLSGLVRSAGFDIYLLDDDRLVARQAVVGDPAHLNQLFTRLAPGDLTRLTGRAVV